MKKQLEDRYIVVKKADVDANALNCLEDHLLANGIPRRVGMFVEVHHDVYPQVRNLCLYGNIYGPDLLSIQELDTETVTTESDGELTRTVTRRVFRSKPETVLSSVFAGDLTATGHTHTKENVSPEVTRHQAEQLGVKITGCQTVQPIGYYCTRAFGHTGPCACVPHAAPTIPKPPTDLDMYAYYIQQGLTDYAYKLEQKHLLDGYSPELVTVGLAALEDGKDPIEAIEKYTAKTSAPAPTPAKHRDWCNEKCAAVSCMCNIPPSLSVPPQMPAPAPFPFAPSYAPAPQMPTMPAPLTVMETPPMAPAPVPDEKPVYGCETCKDSGRVLIGTKRERRCIDCVNGE